MAKKHDQESAEIEISDDRAEYASAMAREPLPAGAALADARAQAGDDARASLPEPAPGDPDYDWSQHYPTGAELYTHTYSDGKVVALRQFRDIYSKQFLRSIRHLETDFDIESAAIDRGACEAAQELIDSRPCPVDGPDDFAELWKAWTSAGTDEPEGVAAGE